MESFKVHLYLRHYVHDKITFETYKEIIKKILRAQKVVKFNFNMLLNYSADLSVELRDRLMEISKKLIELEIGFSVAAGRGAGEALFDLMEESLSNVAADMSKSVVIVLDGDAYAIDQPEVLRRIRNISTKVIEEDAMLGLAQRTVVKLPVVGKGSSHMEIQEKEMMREIDELYSALVLKGHLPVKRSNEIKSPPGYKLLGDPVPGFYCINITHKNFPKFFGQIEKDAMRANMTTFTGDTYMVLLASKFGSIVTEVIPLADNPPGGFSLDIITSRATELGKTVLRNDFLEAVKSDENKKLLEKFYPGEYVEKVRRMILKGLSEK